MSEELQSQPSPDGVNRKAVYETPALARLGSVADVTQGGTMSGLDAMTLGSIGIE